MGSGAPSGKRNGQYRHGEGTKVAIAEQREFSALLKMAPRWPDVKFVMACGDFQMPDRNRPAHDISRRISDGLLTRLNDRPSRLWLI